MTTSEKVYWASRKTRKTRISLFRIFPPSAHFLLVTRRTRYFHVEFSCFEIAEIMLVESSYSHEVLMLPCNENHKVSHRRIFSFIIIPFFHVPFAVAPPSGIHSCDMKIYTWSEWNEKKTTLRHTAMGTAGREGGKRERKNYLFYTWNVCAQASSI